MQNATTPQGKKHGGGDALKLAATCLGVRTVPGRESLWQEVMHLGWGCGSIKAKPGRLPAQHSARCAGEVCGHPSPGCPPRDVGSSRTMSTEQGEGVEPWLGEYKRHTSVPGGRTANISAGFCYFPFYSMKNDVAVMIAVLCFLKSKLSASDSSADVLLRFLKK